MHKPPPGLEFYGCSQFRSILACSLLSGRTVAIKDIRSSEPHPGLQDFEFSLLNLISLLTNGTSVEIGQDSTSLLFKPGIITNHDGKACAHNCKGRSVVYFLEAIAPIILFGKAGLRLTLLGLTSDQFDASIDSFKASTLPLLRQFGVDNLVIDVIKKGFPAIGERHSSVGEIRVRFNRPIRELQSVCLDDQGKIKKIRGTVSALKVSPELLNRAISAARGVFNKLLPDVWISTDLRKLEKGDKDSAGATTSTEKVAPCYDLSLTAQSTTGSMISVDELVRQGGVAGGFEDPEDFGARAAERMLDQIIASGFVDSTSLPLTLLLMALSTNQNISSLKVRKLSKKTVAVLQTIWKFFAIKFKIQECEDDIVYLEESDQEKEEQEEGEASSQSDSEKENSKSISSAIEAAREKLPKALVLSCLGFGLQNQARKVAQ